MSVVMSFETPADPADVLTLLTTDHDKAKVLFSEYQNLLQKEHGAEVRGGKTLVWRAAHPYGT